MPFLEFGATSGLAYKHDFAAEQQHNLALFDMQRKLRLDAENRARLEADETKLPVIMNDWDRVKAQAAAENGFKEVKKWELANPDYKINPAKLRERRMLLEKAINNEHTLRGMRNDKAIEDYTKFIASTPGAYARPELLSQADEISNYKRTGDIKGEAGLNREFVFRNPIDQDKMMKSLQEAAAAANKHGYRAATSGYGGYEQFVTDADKNSSIENYMVTHSDGELWKWKYQQDKELQKLYPDFKDYLKNIANPYFKEADIVPGKFFDPKNGTTRDAQGNIVGGLNPLEDLFSKAAKSAGKFVQGDRDAIDALYRNVDNEYDLSRAQLRNNQGQIVNINPGLVRNAAATGEVIWVPEPNNGGYMAGVFKVKMTTDEFESRIGNKVNNKFFGTGLVDTGIGKGIVREEYGYPITVQKEVDKEGNDIEMVHADVLVPIDRANSNHELRYAKALGAKTFEAGTTQQGPRKIAEATGPNGAEIVMLEDGQWYNLDGTPFKQ